MKNLSFVRLYRINFNINLFIIWIYTSVVYCMFYICFCRIFANKVSILYYSITSAEEQKLFLPAFSAELLEFWSARQERRRNWYIRIYEGHLDIILFLLIVVLEKSGGGRLPELASWTTALGHVLCWNKLFSKFKCHRWVCNLAGVRP